ncbi:MAG: hypothetical protein WCS96_00635, partial [Victivallales bacterium]
MSLDASSKVFVGCGCGRAVQVKSIHVIILIGTIISLFCIPKHCYGEAGISGTELRRKLFIIERQLSKRETTPRKSLTESALNINEINKKIE